MTSEAESSRILFEGTSAVATSINRLANVNHRDEFYCFGSKRGSFKNEIYPSLCHLKKKDHKRRKSVADCAGCSFSWRLRLSI